MFCIVFSAVVAVNWVIHFLRHFDLLCIILELDSESTLSCHAEIGSNICNVESCQSGPILLFLDHY